VNIASRLLRPAWLELDLDAAAENLRSVRRLVGAERKIFAVLKADGYGFGAREMAEVFVAHGADALAFADLTDAVWARRQGVSLPILVFPNSLPAAAAHVIAHRLIPTITDLDEAHAYAEQLLGVAGWFGAVFAEVIRDVHDPLQYGAPASPPSVIWTRPCAWLP